MKITSFSLAFLIVFGSISAFPLIAAFSEILSINSTNISITVRAFIAFISIFFLVSFFKINRKKNSTAILSLIIFGVLYVCRVFYDYAFVDIPLSRPEYIFFIFFVGGCFLPALALSGTSNLIQGHEINKFSKIFLLTSPVVLLTILGSDYYSFENNGYTVETTRMGLRSLNPIFSGHYAVSVLLVLIYLIKWRRPSNFEIIFYIFLFIIALQVAIGSGSRGPIIAGLLTFLILELGLIGFILIFSFLLLFANFVFDEIVQFLSIFEGTTLIDRFSSSIDIISNGDGRVAQYANALLLISESPITGGYLEDPKFMVYPHNIFLESLMTIGITGGILIVYLIFKSVRNAIMISSKNREFKIFAALLIQYIIAAQFSGGIYTSTTMWAFIGFFCTTNSLQLIRCSKI